MGTTGWSSALHWFLVISGDTLVGTIFEIPSNNLIPPDRNWHNEFTGMPMSRLHVSVLQAIGVPVTCLHLPSIRGEYIIFVNLGRFR